MENEEVQEQELEETLEETNVDTTSVDYKAEAAKYKAIADRKAKQLDKLKEGLEEDETNKVTKEQPLSEAERFERLELKVDGYSDVEIDFLLKNGGKDAAGDEMVTAAIEAKRAKDKSEGAVPEGDAKSPVFRRHTQNDLENMSLEQLEEIIPQE